MALRDAVISGKSISISARASPFLNARGVGAVGVKQPRLSMIINARLLELVEFEIIGRRGIFAARQFSLRGACRWNESKGDEGEGERKETELLVCLLYEQGFRGERSKRGRRRPGLAPTAPQR